MKRELQLNGQAVSVEVHRKDSKGISFQWQGQDYAFELVSRQGPELILRDSKNQLHRLQVDGEMVSGGFAEAQFASSKATATGSRVRGGDLTAPMPGKVFKVLVKVGDSLKAGQTIMILEAMKMEHAIKAGKDGVLKKLFFQEGDLVQGGKLLAELDS